MHIKIEGHTNRNPSLQQTKRWGRSLSVGSLSIRGDVCIVVSWEVEYLTIFFLIVLLQNICLFILFLAFYWQRQWRHDIRQHKTFVDTCLSAFYHLPCYSFSHRLTEIVDMLVCIAAWATWGDINPSISYIHLFKGCRLRKIILWSWCQSVMLISRPVANLHVTTNLSCMFLCYSEADPSGEKCSNLGELSPSPLPQKCYKCVQYDAQVSMMHVRYKNVQLFVRSAWGLTTTHSNPHAYQGIRPHLKPLQKFASKPK